MADWVAKLSLRLVSFRKVIDSKNTAVGKLLDVPSPDSFPLGLRRSVPAPASATPLLTSPPPQELHRALLIGCRSDPPSPSPLPHPPAPDTPLGPGCSLYHRATAPGFPIPLRVARFFAERLGPRPLCEPDRSWLRCVEILNFQRVSVVLSGAFISMRLKDHSMRVNDGSRFSCLSGLGH